MDRLLPNVHEAIPVVLIERYLCQDSVVVVYTLDTGAYWVVLTPYN